MFEPEYYLCFASNPEDNLWVWMQWGCKIDGDWVMDPRHEKHPSRVYRVSPVEGEMAATAKLLLKDALTALSYSVGAVVTPEGDRLRLRMPPHLVRVGKTKLAHYYREFADKCLARAQSEADFFRDKASKIEAEIDGK